MLNKWESDFDQLRHATDSSLNTGIGDVNLMEGPQGFDETGILQMIWSQRDRFKAKIHELETSNRSLEQKSKALEIQLKSLKHDNVKLYEKIKYLQTYASTSTSYPTSTTATSGDASVDVENRYKEMYEATVNPFVEFNRKVRSDKYKSLNPAEKLILSTTKFFLATKKTRLFLFTYMVCLHLLIFSTLWRMVHV